ncbi:MAG: hypothetical protein AAFN81_25420 [Bacteroidota bacterium]
MDNPKPPQNQVKLESVKPAVKNFIPEEGNELSISKSRGKPKYEYETKGVEAKKKQQGFDTEEYKKTMAREDAEREKRNNKEPNEPKASSKTAKGGGKISNLVKGALNGATKALTFLGRINLVVGPATMILETENTVNEATEQAALQAYSEQKGNQFAQVQEKAASVAVEKDDEPALNNSGVVTTPEQGTENINAPSSFDELDQDAVISSMQAGYDFDSTASDDTPTIDNGERDGILTAMASDYTENEDVGSFYWEVPDIDVDMDVDGGGTSDSGGDGGGDD